MGCVFLFLITGICVLLLVENEAAAAGAAEGLRLFAESVLPALFPFMVCGHYIAGCGLPRPGKGAGKAAGPLYALGASLLCFACGTPSASLICSRAHAEGMDRKRASMLCAALNQTGPLFIIGVLSAKMLGAKGLWPVFVSAHFAPSAAAACAIGFDSIGAAAPLNEEAPSAKFAAALSEAVSAVLRVGGAIVFFRVLTAAAEGTGLLPHASGTAKALTSGLLEMTNGLALLTEALPPTRLCCAACAAMLGFGGICLYAQSKLFFRELAAPPYFAVKAALAAASFAAAYLLYPLAGGSVSASACGGALMIRDRAASLASLAVCMLFSAASAFIYARLAVRRRGP